MTTQLLVDPQGIDQLSVQVALGLPDDEEVALCRLALGALCRGTTTLRMAQVPQGVRALGDALALLGARCEFDAKLGELRVHGVGLFGLQPSELAIDARGHLAVGALLIGLCISRPFSSEIWVDSAVAAVLNDVMGQTHRIEGALVEEGDETKGVRLTLFARPEEEGRPSGITLRDAGVFAWAKQAAILAGLRAGSPTVFEESVASADHMERALLRAKAPLDSEGSCVIVHPPRDDDALAPQVYERIGSPDLGLCVIAAATAAPRGHLELKDVSLNPGRIHGFSLLKATGLGVTLVPEGDRQGEPVGRVRVSWDNATPNFRLSQERGIRVAGESSYRMGDSVLMLLAMACSTQAPWTFMEYVPHGRGGDGRIWGRALGLLRSAGALVEESSSDGGSVQVKGTPSGLLPLTLTSGGDPRLVLLGSALALRARAPSRLDDVDCLRDLFPKWVGTMRALGVKVEIQHD